MLSRYTETQHCRNGRLDDPLGVVVAAPYASRSVSLCIFWPSYDDDDLAKIVVETTPD